MAPWLLGRPAGESRRGLVVSEAKRFEAQLGRNRLRKLKVRRIEPVEKPKEGQGYDKLQIGTWVADRLCSYESEMRARPGSRIKSQLSE